MYRSLCNKPSLIKRKSMKRISIFLVTLTLFINLLTGISFSQNHQTPDFGPYMRNVQSRIKANWQPPKGYEALSATALFKVYKDGNIGDVQIIKSSGLKEFDEKAITAIQLTSPFRPLPKEYTQNSVNIQFTFDYKVFSSNSQKSETQNTQSSQTQSNTSESTYKSRHERAIEKAANLLEFFGIEKDLAKRIISGLFLLIFAGIFFNNLFSKKSVQYQNFVEIEDPTTRHNETNFESKEGYKTILKDTINVIRKRMSEQPEKFQFYNQILSQVYILQEDIVEKRLYRGLSFEETQNAIDTKYKIKDIALDELNNDDELQLLVLAIYTGALSYETYK